MRFGVLRRRPRSRRVEALLALTKSDDEWVRQGAIQAAATQQIRARRGVQGHVQGIAAQPSRKIFTPSISDWAADVRLMKSRVTKCSTFRVSPCSRSSSTT